MPYRPEPAPPAHPPHTRTAILWCNLGTPDAATPSAVRRFLADFLSDPRVVEIPRMAWWPILHGLILRLRPAQSAQKYASIWTPEGSPLQIWTEKQAKLLQGWLGHHGHAVVVKHAMRYGNPGMHAVIGQLKKHGITRMVVLPAYPQYSCTTTASLADSVFAWSRSTRHLPEWRFVNSYHDHPLYIEALARQVQSHWAKNGRGKVLVMSFHGTPQRTRQLGDPYADECLTTGRLLADALGLLPQQYHITFQSRFGRAAWLQPYTEPTVQALARQGADTLDVICPGFVCDCLETLQEINGEVRHAYLQAGGKTFQYIPCLNDNPDWIAALGAISLQHLAGWSEAQPPTA